MIIKKQTVILTSALLTFSQIPGNPKLFLLILVFNKRLPILTFRSGGNHELKSQ